MTIHLIQGWKVRTDCVCPPIPVRDFDWCAYLADHYDGAEDSRGLAAVVGTGATEEKAIDELLEQIDDLQAGGA